jgi:hypothetical protein
MFMYLIAIYRILLTVYALLRNSYFSVPYVIDEHHTVAIIGFCYAIILAILAYCLNRKQRWAWWGTIILTGLTIIEPIGIFDINYFAPAITIFVLALLSIKFLRPIGVSLPNK